MLRTSALQVVAKPGRFGADRGAPGVVLSVICPKSLVMVLVRKGKAKAVQEVFDGWKKVVFLWAGPDQFYIYNTPHAELKKRLEGLASVVDQSHSRVVIHVDGPKTRALLAKGTPIDLHESEFPIGKSALTQMAHVSVHLTRTGQDEFTLSVFRGFSESFWEWLTSQAGEFGYQVS